MKNIQRFPTYSSQSSQLRLFRTAVSKVGAHLLRMIIKFA